MSKPSIREHAERLISTFEEQATATGEFRLVAPVRDRYMSLCDLSDQLAAEFGAKDVKIGVNPMYRDGEIFFDTGPIEFQNGASHPFFQYLGCADSVQFSQADPDTLRITFTVKDLWVPA